MRKGNTVSQNKDECSLKLCKQLKLKVTLLLYPLLKEDRALAWLSTLRASEIRWHLRRARAPKVRDSVEAAALNWGDSTRQRAGEQGRPG